jgi:hypothetical protein
MRTRTSILLLICLWVAAGTASASTIFLGFDTQGAVQKYSTAGAFLGNFGQTGATGSALDGAGHVWTVAPAFGNNNIERYDAAGTLLNVFTAAVNGNWIEDMAYGTSNDLWASTFEGNVFNIDATTGAVLSSFAVAGSTFTGVAFDGTNLWVTDGLSGGTSIHQYSTAGVLLSTIDTGFTNGGLGYDRSDNTLWGGDFGTVRQYDLSGTLLSSFVAGSAFHDGLEIGDVGGSAPVPEPVTLLLLGLGLAGLGFARKRPQ